MVWSRRPFTIGRRRPVSEETGDEPVPSRPRVLVRLDPSVAMVSPDADLRRFLVGARGDRQEGAAVQVTLNAARRWRDS